MVVPGDSQWGKHHYGWSVLRAHSKMKNHELQSLARDVSRPRLDRSNALGVLAGRGVDLSRVVTEPEMNEVAYVPWHFAIDAHLRQAVVSTHTSLASEGSDIRYSIEASLFPPVDRDAQRAAGEKWTRALAESLAAVGEPITGVMSADEYFEDGVYGNYFIISSNPALIVSTVRPVVCGQGEGRWKPSGYEAQLNQVRLYVRSLGYEWLDDTLAGSVVPELLIGHQQTPRTVHELLFLTEW